MKDWIKPIVIVSQCLGFEACRYNGKIIPNHLVEKLKEFVVFKPLCPEVEIGLGIPRNPIRIISQRNKRFLYEPERALDLSQKMMTFSHQFLSQAGELEGFILKSRSPSCGLHDVKIYNSKDQEADFTRGSGFFSSEVQKAFSDGAIEDEERLKNINIREHFLIRLFTFAQFRGLTQEILSLVRFHRAYEPLFTVYKPHLFKHMKRILENQAGFKLNTVFSFYKKELIALFNKPRKINTILLKPLFPNSLFETLFNQSY